MSAITTPATPLPQGIDLREIKRAAAKAEILNGLKLVAIGAVITGVTYAIASPGGMFIVSFAPLFGVFHTLHGLYKLATA
jgi:uncharacterized membrane protein